MYVPGACIQSDLQYGNVCVLVETEPLDLSVVSTVLGHFSDRNINSERIKRWFLIYLYPTLLSIVTYHTVQIIIFIFKPSSSSSATGDLPVKFIHLEDFYPKVTYDEGALVKLQ